MAIVVSVNYKTVTKKIKLLSSKLNDMTPFFKDIADKELSQTKLRFIEEKDPDGKKWPDSFSLRKGTGPETGSGRYAKTSGWQYVINSNYHAAPPGFRFFNRGRGDKVLRDTGRLLKSLGRAYGKDYALVGTNVQYAKDHQEGNGVKQRRILGINKMTIANIESSIKFYLGRIK